MMHATVFRCTYATELKKNKDKEIGAEYKVGVRPIAEIRGSLRTAWK